MLRTAFKEWAVICRALAEGRQAVILRKGGIAEEGGEFRPEHSRFWLYPTWGHQQRTGLRSEASPLLEEVMSERPPEGLLRLTHFAEVGGVYRVNDIASALALSGFHLWSLDTVKARFEYRWPGLFVLPVRVYKASQVHELTETADYAGCKSWVELDQDLPIEGAAPVLSEDAFRDVMRRLDDLLRPTALA